MMMRKCAALFCLMSWVMGCASTPHPTLDYVLAREAYESAKEVNAAKFAPSAFERAEETYQQAVDKYNNGAFKEAGELFRLAKAYSERAENVARLSRMKSGDEGI